MFTFKPSSFKLKNILGALGSFTAATLTGGMAPIIASAIPGGTKIISAHSKEMQLFGTGVAAVGAAAGAAILAPSLAAMLPASFAKVGGFLGTALKVMGPVGTAMKLFGGAVPQQQLSAYEKQVQALGAYVEQHGTLPPSGPVMTFLRSLPEAGQKIIVDLIQKDPEAAVKVELSGEIPSSWYQALGVPPPPPGTVYVSPGVSGANVSPRLEDGPMQAGIGGLGDIPPWVWMIGAGGAAVALGSFQRAGRPRRRR